MELARMEGDPSNFLRLSLLYNHHDYSATLPKHTGNEERAASSTKEEITFAFTSVYSRFALLNLAIPTFTKY